MNKLELQLFIDAGNKFNEKDSIKIPYIEGQTKYEFDVSKICSKFYDLRIDPLNESCVITLGNCYIIDRSNNIHNLVFQFSNADIFEGIMYFVTNDPQIFFSINGDSQIDTNFIRAVFEINFYHYISKTG